MTKMISTPAGVAVPLPRLAVCPNCEQDIQVRKDQTLFEHDRKSGPNDPIYLDNYGLAITRCPNSGWWTEELLEPTFVRWLWMQSRRRDDRTNTLTRFAAFQFRGCTQSPRRTARDMTWATAEELHGQLHLVQLARTGSAMKGPLTGENCDWMCDYLQQADRVHRQLLADRVP
ncbi:hypothetical protein ACFW2V_12845 [Streptomyces sp. NPDC058947]|uniref:hypothetical protein n=1 Tax=Streptomyces sp. NPDC058947 TaxID=3346675 RepID=UPI0036B40848